MRCRSRLIMETQAPGGWGRPPARRQPDDAVPPPARPAGGDPRDGPPPRQALRQRPRALAAQQMAHDLRGLERKLRADLAGMAISARRVVAAARDACLACAFSIDSHRMRTLHLAGDEPWPWSPAPPVAALRQLFAPSNRLVFRARQIRDPSDNRLARLAATDFPHWQRLHEHDRPNHFQETWSFCYRVLSLDVARWQKSIAQKTCWITNSSRSKLSTNGGFLCKNTSSPFVSIEKPSLVVFFIIPASSAYLSTEKSPITSTWLWN